MGLNSRHPVDAREKRDQMSKRVLVGCGLATIVTPRAEKTAIHFICSNCSRVSIFTNEWFIRESDLFMKCECGSELFQIRGIRI